MNSVSVWKRKAIILAIEGQDMPLPTDPSLTIGDTSQPGDEHPDIDLRPYSHGNQGVSRCHIMINRLGNVAHVVSLAPTARTWLNGQLLKPGSAYLVVNDDTLRLGTLEMKVAFRTLSADISPHNR